MADWFANKSNRVLVAKPTVNFSGIWTNGLGSQMELTSNGNQLSGVYSTAVGSPPPSAQFALSGWVNGDLISFCVNWANAGGDYGSMTAWVGQHTKQGGEERIDTMWHLVKNIEDKDEPSDLWSAFLSGCNRFTKAVPNSSQD